MSTRSRGFTHARAGTNHFELMKRFRSSLLFFSLLSAVLSVAQVCFAQVNSARMLSGINAQTGTSYTFVALDSTRITTFSNGSAIRGDTSSRQFASSIRH